MWHHDFPLDNKLLKGMNWAQSPACITLSKSSPLTPLVKVETMGCPCCIPPPPPNALVLRYPSGILLYHKKQSHRLQIIFLALGLGSPSHLKSTYQCRTREFDPWVRKFPWRRKWQPIPVFLFGKSHGQKSLMGYSPWGHKRVWHDWVTDHTCKEESSLAALSFD